SSEKMPFLKVLAEDTERNTLIINTLLDIPSPCKTLVYACTVEHAELLASLLTTLGRRAVSISSKTPNVLRREIINQFKDGEIEFVCNYGVLTTGFDAPTTDHIIICRPTSSEILYEQIIGR